LSFPFFLFSRPLEVAPLFKIQLEGLWERCELPSEVWGEALAEIEFNAFQLLKMRSGGNILNYFSENKLTKLANLVQFKHMLMFCLED